MELDAYSRAARDKRIAARRTRIQEKAAAAQLQPQANGEVTVRAKVQLRHPLQVLAQSKQDVQQLQESTTAKVTEVQQGQAARDDAHRQKHQVQLQEATSLVQQALQESTEQEAALASKWEEILGLQLASELLEALEEQKKACEGLQAAKDTAAGALSSMLQGNDEEYVSVLKQQAAEQDTLLQLFAQQNEDVQEACANQLKVVEAALQQEKEEQVASALQQVTAALLERSQAEQSFMERYVTSLDDNQAQLEEQYIANAADYNALKDKLDHEVHDMEQRMSGLRASYILNQEKLLYTHHVLTQRDTETRLLLPELKHQLIQQGKTLAELKAKLATANRGHADSNTRLTHEHQRIASHLSDLQAHMLRKQLADLRKFHEIRLLREEQVKALVLKVREVDAAIQEGLLAGTLLNTHALAAPSASTTLAGPGQAQLEASSSGTAAARGPADQAAPSAQQREADATLAAVGITPSSNLHDIDAGLRTLTQTVTSQAQASPLSPADTLGLSSMRGSTHSLTGSPGRPKQAAEDADLQFFTGLDGYNPGIPKAWPLLEKGLKNYHRLLQERALAMTQMRQLQERHVQLHQLIIAQKQL